MTANLNPFSEVAKFSSGDLWPCSVLLGLPLAVLVSSILGMRRAGVLPVVSAWWHEDVDFWCLSEQS